MDLLAAQIQDIKQHTPPNLGGQLHSLNSLFQTLEDLMGQLVPTPFHIPIPVKGYYCEVLEGVASRFKATSMTSSLSRGTYADEMFMYESGHAKFEITLCNLEWSDLFDAALSEVGIRLLSNCSNSLPSSFPVPPSSLSSSPTHSCLYAVLLLIYQIWICVTGTCFTFH